MQQYFICVEQQLIMETSNILSAIYFCLGAHYILNLSYHRKTGDVWLFVQEKILGLAGKKQNPSSVSHFGGITRMYHQSIDSDSDS